MKQKIVISLLKNIIINLFIIFIIGIFLIPINRQDKSIKRFEYKEGNYTCSEVTLKDTLKNKKLSILGDSISTFDGYSNNSQINSTIGLSVIHYPKEQSGIVKVYQTWWMKFANNVGMKVLVNNSWAGSRVYSKQGYESFGYAGYGDLRTGNLHNNYGEKPDVIAIYLGVNDFLQDGKTGEVGTYNENLYKKLIINNNDSYDYVTPNNFTEAYIIMLHKVKTKYKDSEIFCFTIPPVGSNPNNDVLKSYNNSIKKISEYFGVQVVDLYNNSGINMSNYSKYVYDNGKIHPNVDGMDVIESSFRNTVSLITKYYNKSGISVTEEEYKADCGLYSCEVVNNKYYNKSGDEVSEKEFKNQCLDNDQDSQETFEQEVEVPDPFETDTLILSIIFICVGIVSIFYVLKEMKKEK